MDGKVAKKLREVPYQYAHVRVTAVRAFAVAVLAARLLRLRRAAR